MPALSAAAAGLMSPRAQAAVAAKKSSDLMASLMSTYSAKGSLTARSARDSNHLSNTKTLSTEGIRGTAVRPITSAATPKATTDTPLCAAAAIEGVEKLQIKPNVTQWSLAGRQLISTQPTADETVVETNAVLAKEHQDSLTELLEGDKAPHRTKVSATTASLREKVRLILPVPLQTVGTWAEISPALPL
jgi:hypothetical protein